MIRKQIKKDLTDQLKTKGVKGKHFYDLIDDYLAMWDLKSQLIADIEERGVSIKYQNGKNQWGSRKNDSVNDLLKTNNQMLKLLGELGLKTSDFEGREERPTEM